MLKFWEVGKKIVAVGRNYAAHAKELKNEVPSAPFFFLKPTTAYLLPGSPILIPKDIGEVHHEGIPSEQCIRLESNDRKMREGEGRGRRGRNGDREETNNNSIFIFCTFHNMEKIPEMLIGFSWQLNLV